MLPSSQHKATLCASGSHCPTTDARRAIGLYRAADDAELQAILESLPLRPWMEISVTALAEHPNDPALSSAPTP